MWRRVKCRQKYDVCPALVPCACTTLLPLSLSHGLYSLSRGLGPFECPSLSAHQPPSFVPLFVSLCLCLCLSASLSLSISLSRCSVTLSPSLFHSVAVPISPSLRPSFSAPLSPSLSLSVTQFLSLCPSFVCALVPLRLSVCLHFLYYSILLNMFS